MKKDWDIRRGDPEWEDRFSRYVEVSKQVAWVFARNFPYSPERHEVAKQVGRIWDACDAWSGLAIGMPADEEFEIVCWFHSPTFRVIVQETGERADRELPPVIGGWPALLAELVDQAWRSHRE